MTDEELEKTIQDVCESIDNLPKRENLSKEEARHKQLLLLQKETLERIKEAREKNQKSEELYNSMVYGLLTSWGEKHPYLASLIKSNFRWNTF